MKKFLATFLLVITTTIFSQSSFYVDIHNISCIDTIGSEMVFTVEVTNTSTSELTLAFVRTANELPAEWVSSFCFDLCFPDFIDSIATTEDFLSSPLTPGETREFTLHVFAMTNDGTGMVDVKILNLNSPQDNVTHSFYSTTEVAPDENAFTFTTGETALTDTTGSEIVFYFDIHNTSPVPLVLEFNKEDITLPDAWFTSLCLDVCFPDFIDTITTTEAFGSSPLMPDETREFSAHFFTSTTEGTGVMKINAVNLINPSDNYSFELSATANAPVIGNTFTATAEISSLTDTLGSEIVFYIEVENTSSAPLTMDFIRTVNDLPGEWTSSLCFDACFPPTLDSISTNATYGSSPLNPGETRELSLHFFPLTNTGTGTVKIVAKDHDNPQLQTELVFTASATTTSLNDEAGVLSYKLHQNYPNPFNPATIITFNLKEAGYTKLVVYDILGNEIAVPVSGFISAGEHKIAFDATNLTSGVYVYKITSGQFTETKKMILEK